MIDEGPSIEQLLMSSRVVRIVMEMTGFLGWLDNKVQGSKLLLGSGQR